MKCTTSSIKILNNPIFANTDLISKSFFVGLYINIYQKWNKKWNLPVSYF